MKFPAAELIASAFFLVCLLTTGIGALIAVFTTRIIRSVCGLAITCLERLPDGFPASAPGVLLR